MFAAPGGALFCLALSPPMCYNFDEERRQLALDDYSLSVLKLYKSRSSLTLSQLSAILNRSWLDVADPALYLKREGYLRVEPNHAALHDISDTDPIDPDTPLVISFEGKGALEAELKARKRLSFNEIRAWITLAIAVLAFFKSFFF